MFGRTARRVVLALAVIAGAAPSHALGQEQALRPTDDRLQQLVEAALAADPVVESFEIVVTVFEGNVRLNGAVDTEDERARAGSLAADINGVVEVENRITVEEPLVSPDRSDSEIRRDLVAEVEEAFPEASVDVTVEDGMATLTGAVATREARRRITEIAFRAGALLVKNELTIGTEAER